MTPLTAVVAAALLAGAGGNDAVLVQFSSQTCAPCRAMEPTVSRLITDGYPVQQIDVDKHPETARQFKVRGVPTFVLLVGNQEADRVEGAASYDRLAAMFAVQPRDAAPPPPSPTPAPPDQTAIRPTDFRGGTPEQQALAASVRLRVEDATGFGFGTGTIIDTHDDEALVVTCGHLFRESQGKGRISVELFAPGAAQPVEGHLIAYDLDRDIALVSIRPGMAIRPVAIAPPGFAVRKADRVFTVGCDKGADATVRQSQITAVNRFLGKPNFSAAGAPIDGRSGGGLFTAEGQLIGVCNAADHASDEGLYAGLASIHWQLDQIGQSEIYQRSAVGQLAAASPPATAADQPAFAAPAVAPPPTTVPELPIAMPVSSAAGGGLTVTPASYSSQTNSQAAAVGAEGDTELVVIVRSKRNPDQRSEIYLVDQASPDLLAGIVSAARQGAAERAASMAARQPMPTSGGSPRLYRAPPVIRAQSGE
jgi:S1-C subfamily serine protease